MKFFKRKEPSAGSHDSPVTESRLSSLSIGIGKMFADLTAQMQQTADDVRKIDDVLDEGLAPIIEDHSERISALEAGQRNLQRRVAGLELQFTETKSLASLNADHSSTWKAELGDVQFEFLFKKTEPGVCILDSATVRRGEHNVTGPVYRGRQNQTAPQPFVKIGNRKAIESRLCRLIKAGGADHMLPEGVSVH